MKWATLALVALLALVTLGGAATSGFSTSAAPTLRATEASAWRKRLEGLVPPLGAQRMGPGCAPLTEACTLLRGKGSGRVTLRLRRAAAPQTLHFAPRGEDAVPFNLKLKPGKSARLTVPEAGAQLRLRGAPCSPQASPPCELAFE